MRRVLLSVVCVWLAFLPLNARAESQFPDIYLLMVDTLRADKLGLYGNPSPASTELDKLAKQGVVFERMISQASWTRSSVASILSGRYPRDVGVLKERWDVLREDVETLAERLKGFGYETIGITANPQLNRNFGFAQGFDQYIESTVLFNWMKAEHGKVKASKTAQVRSADQVLNQAQELIAKRSKKPLFFQTMLMDVHAHHRIQPEEVDSDLKSFKDARYLQAVRQASKALGHFLEPLVKKGFQNSIVIITADHGEGLEDHPDVTASKGHGNLLYRSQIHIPFIVLGDPRFVKAGVKIAEVSEGIDLVPTILDLIGAKDIRAHGSSQLVGRSYFEALSKSGVLSPNIDTFAFSETSWRKVDKVAIITKDWFYVESDDGWEGTDKIELQPFEGPQDGSVTNLLEKHPSIAQKLKQKLEGIVRNYSSDSKQRMESEDQSPLNSEEMDQLKSLGYL